MKFSENWLRTWVNPAISSAELVEKLTMAGLEVDSAEPVAPPFEQVCVGEVLSAEQHPDADKLRVCQVNIHAAAPLTIVCGAANVAAGQKVAVAQVGAQLPGNVKIKKSKLRGVASEGMICSSKELALTEHTDGIWVLPNDAPVGQDLREYLALDDVSIDVDITPNRSDCLGIAGIAREVGLLTQTDVHIPDVPPVAATIAATFPVQIEHHQACPRYVGRVIRDINPQATTPLWLQERLRRSGLRSISPVVDVTNYVLLELGQPMHAFDLDRLHGGIIVRMAQPQETLTLLDEQKITLDSNSLLIADEQQPLALAGVMGGLGSAVSDATRAIFLESAFFAPEHLAGTARRYGLHTDSSYRFERGVDPYLQRTAVERATALLLEIVGGQPGPVIEVVNEALLPQKQPIRLRAERITRLLGIAIPAATVTESLQRLGMQVEQHGETWQVVPPSNRFDLTIEADLIEELARVYGYNNLPETRPHTDLQMPHLRQRPLAEVQHTLIQHGYQEAITYSFVAGDLLQQLEPHLPTLTLANPIASDMSVMRTTLWAGLLQAVQHNQKRQQPRVRLFETGLRFINNARHGLQQTAMLAGVATGSAFPEQWGLPTTPLDFYHVKADIEALLTRLARQHPYHFAATTHPALHPGQTAAIYQGETCLGIMGALHPQLVQQLDLLAPVFLFEVQLAPLLADPVYAFNEVSKYPSVRRDLAFIVDQHITAENLLNCVAKAADAELLQQCLLFDVYQGKGIEPDKKSVAIGLIFQAKSRNLTEFEVDAVIEQILATLQQELGVNLRK